MCTSVGQAEPVLSIACVLSGYCAGASGRAGEGAAIAAEEVRLLQTLIAARLATSVTLGFYALSKDPSNEYLKLHAIPGRRSLASVLAIDPAAFRAMVGGIQRESLLIGSDLGMPSVVSIAQCLAAAPTLSLADDAPVTITFVTGNKKKLEEVRAILGAGFPFDLASRAVDLPELQGEPEDVSREKCRLAALQVSCPFQLLMRCA